MDNRKNIKVLVAEDDFLVCEEIVRILRKIGYEVVGTAFNGKQAIEMTCSLKPDAVIMDIKMSKVDGLEATQKIQQSCPTPVVILTAHESRELVDKASKMGASAYLVKPPKPAEIDRAITVAMVRHDDLMELRHLNNELQQEICKRKQVEQVLKESEHELWKLNAIKDKFLSIIAHDLKAPFISLKGLVDILLQSAEELSNDSQNLLKLLQESIDSAYTLLESLLTWARVQRGSMAFLPDKFDLQRIVLANVISLRANASHKKIEVENFIEADTFIYVDPNMINTIVRNLITNALKFTERGGKVEITAKSDGDFVEASFSDSGIGISEKNMSKLFRIEEKYKTVGTAGERGTGLGLALCKEFIEKNGGKIWVKSEVGKGSTFKFTLPKAKE